MTLGVTNDILVRLESISKRYPGVQALDGVSLEIRRGEVHGLVGENGAGKSTLIKIIGGVERADRGSYHLGGKQVTFRSTRDARAAGISVLHQERSIVPTFSVGENVLLEEILSARSYSPFRRREILAKAREYLALIGLDVDAAGPVTGMSAAQLQLIEIARALSVDAKLLVLDEPTASVALQEAMRLLEVIRTLQAQGVAVLYVSHKLEEVFEICDRVTVLRDGRRAGDSRSTADIRREELISLMVGRQYIADELARRPPSRTEVVLEGRGLRGSQVHAPNSFSLRRGEIVGWYGLVGSGRTELAHLILGADRLVEGRVLVHGKPVRIRSVAQALRRYRIGYVSEDRQGEGLFLAHSVAKNLSAATWKKIRKPIGLLDLAAERTRAEALRTQLGIRTPTVNQLVSNLSGGNKQKVSLGKWLIASPEILIIDEPTVGIDIRTKYEVHALIARLAEEGMSVIVISSDLVEVVRLVDRIEVFRGGMIVASHANTRDYSALSVQVMNDILGTSALSPGSSPEVEASSRQLLQQ